MILYFGSKNILGSGWTSWDVAAFTTFLACYTKLSDKSSKAAKLFNAVHKAQVSWKRIHPYMERLLRLRRRMRSQSRLKNSVQKQAKVIRNTASFPQII